jgi:hypothetical protein
MNDLDLAHFERRLRQKGLWLKQASERANGLMRAVSNSLYFTETHHKNLQKRILEYFLASHGNGSLFLGELLNEELCLRFLHSPFPAEFEFVNLELVARIFKKRVKFYFFERGILTRRNFYDSSHEEIRLLRLPDNHYASALPAECEETYELAQNVALSIVDDALEDSSLMFRDHDKDRLISHEQEDRKLRTEAMPVIVGYSIIDSERSLYANHLLPFTSKNDSFYDAEELNSLACNSNESIRSIIIPIMEKRCRNRNLFYNQGSLERKYDLLINSSDRRSTRKLESNTRPSQTHQTKRRTKIVPERPVINTVGQYESLQSTDQETDTEIQTFSSKIFGNNVNLKKSVPVKELDMIFGSGFKQTPILPTLAKPVPFLNADSNFIDQSFSLEQQAETKDGIPTSDELASPKDEMFRDEPLDRTSCSAVDEQLESFASHIDPNGQLFGFHCKDLLVKESNLLASNEHAPTMIPLGVVSQDSPQNRCKRIHLRETFKGKKIEEFKHSSSIDLPSFRSLKPLLPRSSLGTKPSDTTHYHHPSEESSSRSFKPSNTHSRTSSSTKINTAHCNPQPKFQYKATPNERVYTGTLKFFDEKNGLGLISVSDSGNSHDVFVCRSELTRAKIGIDTVRQVRAGAVPTLRFQITTCSDNDSACMKAINIQLNP